MDKRVLSLILLISAGSILGMQTEEDETISEIIQNNSEDKQAANNQFIWVDESVNKFKKPKTKAGRARNYLKCSYQGCVKFFEYKQSLDAHVLKHNKELKEYKCQHCTNTYHLLKLLERHIKNKHAN